MRFLLVMLATAGSGLACEKDPVLSNTTNNLVPAVNDRAATLVDPAADEREVANTPTSMGVSPATSSKVILAVVPEVPRPGSGVPGAIAAPVAAAVSESAVVGRPTPAPSTGIAEPSNVAKAVNAAKPINAEEGNGEPMDDVDDEVVPATDKSGVDKAEADEGPAGPVDEDSEGADIDLRE